jgi:ubiquinone/menaquinone biosynthesis C-methylase UbiE
MNMVPVPDASFWEANPHAAQESQWTSDPFISAEIYRRISNGESENHWIGWLFQEHLSNRPLDRILSIGCGVGDHEVGLAGILPTSRVEAFDFSSASVEIARQKAQAAGLQNVTFYEGDFNKIGLESTAYDLVLCSGSLHHVKEIEHLLGQVRGALRPGGIFVANEYVGDCYNIYGPDQVSLIQRVLNGLPSQLRNADTFMVPTIEQVFARDPTEAVRSRLIPDFLRFYFSDVDERRLGGSLLHPIYPYLNVASLEADRNLHQALINTLIVLDGQRLAQGHSDFSFFICQ